MIIYFNKKEFYALAFTGLTCLLSTATGIIYGSEGVEDPQKSSSLHLPEFIPTLVSHPYVPSCIVGLAALYFTHRWIRYPGLYHATLAGVHALTFYPLQEKNHSTAVTWPTLVEYIQKETHFSQVNLALENSDKMIAVSQGILRSPGNQDLFLFSRGYAPRGSIMPGTPILSEYQNLVNIGGGAMSGYMAFKDNLVPHDATVYTFDYPDERRFLNLGQSIDQECLNVIWQHVVASNKNSPIIGIGNCRGAYTLLSHASSNPEELKALVLISPFVSIDELIKTTAQNHLKFPYAHQTLRTLFGYALPNWNKDIPSIVQLVQMIKPTIPVFIAYRTNDALISEVNIHLLIKALSITSEKIPTQRSIYCLRVDGDRGSHDTISHNKILQQALHAFYAAHQITHDTTLACKGKELLETILIH